MQYVKELATFLTMKVFVESGSVFGTCMQEAMLSGMTMKRHTKGQRGGQGPRTETDASRVEQGSGPATTLAGCELRHRASHASVEAISEVDSPPGPGQAREGSALWQNHAGYGCGRFALADLLQGMMGVDPALWATMMQEELSVTATK